MFEEVYRFWIYFQLSPIAFAASQRINTLSHSFASILDGGKTLNERVRKTINCPVTFWLFNLLLALQMYVPLSMVDKFINVRLLDKNWVFNKVPLIRSI